MASGKFQPEQASTPLESNMTMISDSEEILVTPKLTLDKKTRSFKSLIKLCQILFSLRFVKGENDFMSKKFRKKLRQHFNTFD